MSTKASLRDVQKELRAKVQELQQRDELIDNLEKELADRDTMIQKLKGDISHYKRILKAAGLLNAPSAEKAKKRVRHRMAISAECGTNIQTDLTKVKKVSKPKS